MDWPEEKVKNEKEAMVIGIIGKSAFGDAFEPVKNKKFAYIITNPPFEPTPPESDYLLNSSAGIYGLDMIEEILKNVKKYLRKNGHLQMVTFSPGNKKGPFMLKQMMAKHQIQKQLNLDRMQH